MRATMGMPAGTHIREQGAPKELPGSSVPRTGPMSRSLPAKGCLVRGQQFQVEWPASQATTLIKEGNNESVYELNYMLFASLGFY